MLCDVHCHCMLVINESSCAVQMIRKYIKRNNSCPMGETPINLSED